MPDKINSHSHEKNESKIDSQEKKIQLSSADIHLSDKNTNHKDNQSQIKDNHKMVENGVLPHINFTGEVNSFFSNLQKSINKTQQVFQNHLDFAETKVNQTADHLGQGIHNFGKNVEKNADRIAKRAGHTLDHQLASMQVPKEARKVTNDIASYTYGIAVGGTHLIFNLADGSAKQTRRALHEIAHDPKALFQTMQMGGMGLITQIAKDNIEDVAKAASPSIQRFGNRVNNTGIVHAAYESAINLTRDTAIGARNGFDWLHSPKTTWKDVGVLAGEKVLPITAAGIGTVGLAARGLSGGLAAASEAAEVTTGTAATTTEITAGAATEANALSKASGLGGSAKLNRQGRNVQEFEKPSQSVLEANSASEVSGTKHFYTNVKGEPQTLSNGKHIEVHDFKSSMGPDGSTVNTYDVMAGKRAYNYVDTIGKDGNTVRVISYKGNKVATEWVNEEGRIVSKQAGGDYSTTISNAEGGFEIE